MSRRSRLLNKHIEVFWEPTNLWYGGTVTKYSKGKYLVKYDILNDDGSWEQEWVDLLDKQTIKWRLAPSIAPVTIAPVTIAPVIITTTIVQASGANITNVVNTTIIDTTTTNPTTNTAATHKSEEIDDEDAPTVASVTFEPLATMFKGCLFFRATKPKSRQSTVVTSLPFLVAGGLLKKNWKPPESKRYREDVTRLKLPFHFISTKYFGDNELAVHALSVLRVEWKNTGSKTRFQASSRVCSADSLLLAMKHHPQSNTGVFRDLQLFAEEQQRAVTLMDKNDIELADAHAKISGTKIALQVHAARQKKGKRPQMRQKNQSAALVTSVREYCSVLAHTDMRTVTLPTGLEEWSTVQNTSIKSRFETISAIMTRVADHSISTGRMHHETTAIAFFNSPLFGAFVNDFFEAHVKTGATSTGRLPMARGCRMAVYLHAATVEASEQATAVQNNTVVFRCYKTIWTDANRDRASVSSVQEWNLPLLKLVSEVVDAVVDKAEFFWGKDIVEMDQETFATMVVDCANEPSKTKKAALRRDIVGVRSYNQFVLEGQFILQLALKVGMRPLGFVELDLLTKVEWDNRVTRAGRRPQVER